jgi:NAD(P)-dependent dehydrogenase (short-subunit alcohol dehydrogenase family)
LHNIAFIYLFLFRLHSLIELFASGFSIDDGKTIRGKRKMSAEKKEVAVVIGVGARDGLGAALCRRFAREGLHAVAAGRTQAKLDKVAGEINDSGGSASAIVADTTNDDDVTNLLDQAKDLGDIALAVYNAGNNWREDILDLETETFEKIWRVCCQGGFIFGRESARRMLGQGHGTIIFTGATASIRSRPPFVAFASAKAGLRAVAAGMARDFGPKGLHVAHTIIDGGIAGEKLLTRAPDLVKERGLDGMLGLDDMAHSYWLLHTQPRSAWTFELDMRPYKETF